LIFTLASGYHPVAYLRLNKLIELKGVNGMEKNELQLEYLSRHLATLSNIYRTGVENVDNSAFKVNVASDIIKTLKAINHELGIEQQSERK